MAMRCKKQRKQKLSQGGADTIKQETDERKWRGNKHPFAEFVISNKREVGV